MKNSFAKDLWDGFDVVSKLTGEGLDSVNEMIKFWKEVSKIEAEYAQKLAKACKKAKGEVASNKMIASVANNFSAVGSKFGRFRGKKEKGSLKDGWIQLLNNMESRASIRSEYSKLLSSDLIQSIESIVKEKEIRRKQAVVDGQRALRDYRNAQTRHSKAKTTYVKYTNSLEATQASYDAIVTKGGKEKEAIKLNNKVIALKSKLMDAEQEYQSATKSVNDIQNIYYTQKMPIILESLQRIETARIDKATKFLISTTKATKLFIDADTKSMNDSLKSLSSVSAEDDLSRWIEENKTGETAPEVFVVESAKEISPTAIFGNSLEEIMAFQASTHASLQIPLVVQVLTEKIESMGGFTTEGIFRVPGSQGEVRYLKREFDKANYGPIQSVKDVHVVGSLLKAFLRELIDPVVPGSFYKRCLSSASDPEKSVEIIREIPDLNRRVLTHLMVFLSKFLEEETKMSADNLAMVFAPCLLRNPEGGNDAEAMFAGATLEHAFIRNLVIHIRIKQQEGPPEAFITSPTFMSAEKDEEKTKDKGKDKDKGGSLRKKGGSSHKKKGSTDHRKQAAKEAKDDDTNPTDTAQETGTGSKRKGGSSHRRKGSSRGGSKRDKAPNKGDTNKK